MKQTDKLDRMKLLMEYAFIDHNKTHEEDSFIDELMLEDGDENDEMSFDEPIEDDSNTGMGEETPMDGAEDPMGAEPAPEPAVEPMPAPTEPAPAPEVEPAGDEIELDVTELVDNTEEAKRKADETSRKLDDLTAQIDSVIQASAKIDVLAGSIKNLQDEIVKRNPSKVEKLELQSLHSAPYNVKVGEYWEDKLGDYAEDASTSRPTFDDLESEAPAPLMPTPSAQPIQEPQPEEIIVTQSDVDSDYNEYTVKNSFEDYEEEDIDDYN